MRVLIVTPMYPPDQAGIAMQSSLLAQGLADAGCDAVVFTFTPRDAAVPSGVDAPDVTRADRALRRRKLSWALWRALRGLAADADVVHAHGHTNLNLHAWLARRGRPFFVTYHGTEVWSYEPGRGGAAFRFLTGRAQVVCVSRPLADALREKTGAAAEVIEPAVADAYVAAAARPPAPRGEGPPVLLGVKGLFPVNDPGPLLEAMPRIRAAAPGAELWLAGEGPLRSELEDLARRLGIAESVKFLGLVENEKLADLYARASVFVNTATLESYGNVTVEALACGAPAVACDTAGARALKEKFPADLDLVPIGDPHALADAVIRRLAAPRPVSEKTRSFIRERLSASAMTRRYLALYERARSQPSP